MRTIDLNRAAVFARVAESGGVSAAAAALRLPKSSVSRSVRALEDELGVRLLQKVGRRVGLTEAGRIFYGGVAQGLAAMEEAREAAGGVQGGMRGLVRVAAAAETAAMLLTPILADFLAAHPDVETELRASTRPLDLLREGGADLALHVGRVRSDDLASRRLGAKDAGLFASPAYLARRGTPADPADLAAHEFVLGGSDGDALTLVPLHGGEARRVSARGRHRADTASALHAAVRAGVGIGVLPDVVGSHAVGGERLVRVLPAWGVEGEPLELVWARSRHVPRRVSLLRDLIEERLEAGCSAAASVPCL